jgi:glycosyltransferase involved in cell wall biosynthesis
LVVRAAGRRPLRVLHVAASLAPRFGGPSKVAVEMCEALVRAGLEVVLFTTDLDEWAPWGRLTPRTLKVPTERSVDQNGVEVRYFKTAWPSRLFFSPAMATELRRRTREFDLVHVHSLYLFPTLAATHYARRFARPYIIRPHGTLDPWHRRRHRFRKAFYNTLIERRNLNGAAAIHYTAEEERELARPLGITAPAAVIPPGIDTDEFDKLPPRDAFRRQYPELADKRLVVFLGRLTPKKGLDLLIGAFASVVREFGDAHLVIAGPDDEGYGSLVRRLLQEAGLLDKATILAMVQGEQKLALLADTDVWVLPSYAENFGVAAVEAMACGLPVVLTDRINIHHQVTAAGAGLVVPCRADAVALAIRRILADPALARRLSAGARHLVQSQFTWATAARRLISLYDAVRDAGQGRARVVHAAREHPGP